VKAGAEWAEALCGTSRQIGVIVEKTSIRECEVVRDYTVRVRAFINGGVGFATTRRLGEEAARRCAENAVELARATHPDPDFVALPSPAAAQAQIEGLFDDKLAGLAAAEVVRWCSQGIEEARAVAPDVALSGGGDLVVSEMALASSTGVAVQRRGTHVQLGYFAVVQRGDDVGSYFDQDVARRLLDFEPQGLGTKATTEALRFLGARKVATARLPLVLGPFAGMGVIASAIAAANAESVQRGRSCMVGREGTQIASEVVTVTEDPFIPAGLASTAYDGEGVPKRRLTLLDRGVLTTYLHNSYTANKAGVENTAHAAWGGGITTSNLVPTLGDKTEAELIAELDEGIYINAAGLTPDPVTGDISATIDFGFKIEKGELAYPITTTMVGSDIFELLGKIDAISSDYRSEPGQIMPTVRVRDIQVVGGG